MTTSTRHRATRLLSGLLAATIALSALTTLQAAPAVAAAVDGKTATTAAASCWEIKQKYPSSQNGVYWLVTPALRTPDRFYCDQASYGGGWVLVGRGREGWEYGRNGLSTPAEVSTVVAGPAAFAPKQLDGRTIDGLLNGTRVDALEEGVRIRRAATANGSSWQDNRVDYANMPTWIWPFGGTFPLATHLVSLPSEGNVVRRGTGGTIESFLPTGTSGAGWQTNTAQRPETAYEAGWAYGSTLRGSPAATSYLWTPGTGGYAVPFAQVWIRPRIVSENLYAHPAGTPTLSISSVSARQVFQRDASNTADIPIRGRYTGAAARIEARWNGGPWTIIDATPRGGFYEGTLRDQKAGQGALDVRLVAAAVKATASLPIVGVGDIFAIAGQSNAVGYSWNAKSYAHPTLAASNFGQDDAWKDLVDPVSSGAGQIDRVSRFGWGSSTWPLLATRIMAKTNAPVAFIPAAKGGSSITEWTEGDALYASLRRRIDAVGGSVRAVLWHQGESDAARGMTESEYDERLTSFVRAIARDADGAPTLVANIGSIATSDGNTDPIRLAQKAVVDREPLALDGPAAYDINLRDEGDAAHRPDGVHFRSDADRALLAARWWAAVDAALYGGPSGAGPVLDRSASSYDAMSNTIELLFVGRPLDAARSTASLATFRVVSDGVVLPVRAVDIRSGSRVVLTLSAEPVPGGHVLVSYASTTAGIDHALYDVRGLPAFTAIDVPLAVR